MSVPSNEFDKFIHDRRVDNTLNTVAPPSIRKLTGLTTEKEEKIYIQQILDLIDKFATYPNIKWTNRLEVSIFPNEYANLFSLNRCLSRLLENDILLFKQIGTYNILTLYTDDKVYNEGDRVIAYNKKCNDSFSLYKIYVCLKNNTKGIQPSTSTALQYYESLVIPKSKIPNDKYWAEDAVTLDSFNTGSEGLPWNIFNNKPIEQLNHFSFNDSSAFVKTETYEGANLRQLNNPTENFSWPTNTPIIYSDLAVSNLITDNPGIILYKNDNILTTELTEIEADDYIVSAVVSSNTNNEKVWYKLYKSGWLEQGGIQSVVIQKNDTSKYVLAGETNLIGTAPDANLCIKCPIHRLIQNYELLNFNYSISEISAPDNTFIRIYNNQVILDSTNNTPTVYIAGLSLSSNIDNTETTYPIFEDNADTLSTYIHWESKGIYLQ